MIQNNEEYEIRTSTRAKHVRITVYPDARVVITKPTRASMAQVEKVIAKNQEWIEERLAKFQKRLAKLPPDHQPLPKPRKGSEAYKNARTKARMIATERLQYFNSIYDLPYGNISIRDQKTRWGSCSVKGDLSFNYRLAFLPPHHADYVVVHELCHVKEHNHSEKFWDLVTKTIPDHAAIRKEMRLKYSY